MKTTSQPEANERPLSASTVVSELLGQELSSRRRRRPRYSLRAYARDLGVSASFLCEILAGKANLSCAQAARMGARLDWAPPVRRTFEVAAAASTTRSPSKRALAEARLRACAPVADYRRLESVAFETIAGWEHMALLEALEIPTLDARAHTLQALARRFSLTPARVQCALERLLALGLVERREGQTWATTERRTCTPHDVPNEAVRAYHAALLGQAREALQEPVSEREFGALTLAFAPADMPEAKACLRAFLQDFETRFGRSPHRSQVFQLALQFFEARERPSSPPSSPKAKGSAP